MNRAWQTTADWPLTGAIAGLLLIGIISLYSTTSYDPGYVDHFHKQLLWAAIGIALAAVISLVDYYFWAKYAWPIFWSVIMLLGLTLVVGTQIRGARSWISLGVVNIQPSEFAKLALVILFAHLLSKKSDTEWSGDYDRSIIHRLFIFAFVAGVPLFLVILQPDLGTAATFIPIIMIALFFGGVPLSLLAIFIITITVTVVTVLHLLLAEWAPTAYNYGALLGRVVNDQEILGQFLIILIFLLLGSAYTLSAVLPLAKFDDQHPFRWRRDWMRRVTWGSYLLIIILILAMEMSGFLIDHLKPYQQQRLISFIEPAASPRQGGYNIIQAKIAIGSGGIWGKGFRGGTQHALGFLPEAHTDFIFSIWAEEWGFIGVAALVALWLLLALRCWHIATLARDRFGYYFVFLWSGMVLTQALLNIAVNLGLLPIIGIPLPLISYGGSSLFSNLVGAGIVLSIFRYRSQGGSPGL